MDINRARQASDHVYYFNPEDLDWQRSELIIDTPTEPSYLSFLVPLNETHILPVHISIIPFCLPEHRGQTFHYARASYARCCSGVDPQDSLPMVSAASEKVYKLYVRYHRWDFKPPSSWESFELRHEALSTNETCFQVSTRYLQEVIGPFISESTPSPPAPTQQQGLGVASYRPRAASKSASSSRSQSRRASEDSTATASPGGSTEKSAIQTADDLVNCFENLKAPTSDMRSYYSRLDVSPVDADEPQQCAKQAWKLCTTVAQRAKERFQHAYFTRYVSLCFFLIWESFSTKTGKAGARELNVKMKEAGFEGTSRTLKSLRDETIFINRLLASVRRMYGDKVVSKLMYCVFDSANYRFVRSINRFGEGKKLSAVEYIRNKIGSAPSMEAHFPVIQVQDILKEYLPSLSYEDINAAIRYQPFDTGSHQSSPKGFFDPFAGSRKSHTSVPGDEETYQGFVRPPNPYAPSSSSPAACSPMHSMSDYYRSHDESSAQRQNGGDDIGRTEAESPLSGLTKELDIWFTHFD